MYKDSDKDILDLTRIWNLKFLPEGWKGKIQLNVLQMRKVNFSQVGEALKERSWLGGGCRNHL